jgi:hypothetical protein
MDVEYCVVVDNPPPGEDWCETCQHVLHGDVLLMAKQQTRADRIVWDSIRDGVGTGKSLQFMLNNWSTREPFPNTSALYARMAEGILGHLMFLEHTKRIYRNQHRNAVPTLDRPTPSLSLEIEMTFDKVMRSLLTPLAVKCDQIKTAT